jgi:Arylsulfotransferase (ASST)
VSPLTLSPAFSPSIYDYAVLCSAGTNTLTLGMTATAGGAVSLMAPITTAPAPSASVPVSLNEDQAAVVLAQDATGFTQQYWIRCLPHDFPLVAPRTYPAVGSPTPGWYLIGNLFTAAGSGPFAMIVDENGTPIWYHRMPSGQANPTVVTPLPDSTVGITSSSNPSVGTLYFLKTWTTQAISTVGIPLNNHELRLLPNGDYMLISYPNLTGVDLTGLNGYGPNSTILDCAVQEVDPQGNLVWDWRASNHTDPAKESVVPAGAGTDASPADVYHCNSVDVNADGDVLISFRHMNSVLLVSKTTGDVVWKLSGTPYNKDGAQILTIQGDSEGAFYLQHDARFQPNGDISLFDDHSPAAAVPGVARGVEYALDLGAGTAHVVWQYQASANSAFLGSFRRYADGTNLIGWGDYTGTDNLVFTEVDAVGHDLLDMLFVSRGNWSYRAEKVPIGTFDIDVLRGTAGLP